jgi:hypothetical protein
MYGLDIALILMESEVAIVVSGLVELLRFEDCNVSVILVTADDSDEYSGFFVGGGFRGVDAVYVQSAVVVGRVRTEVLALDEI